MSFSARSASAILPATTSALMLKVCPSLSAAVGAITGTKPCSASMTCGFTPTTSPTRPRSTVAAALAGDDQLAVLAREPDGARAVAVEQRHDLPLMLPGQHLLDDLHRGRVGDAHAAHEARLDARPGARAASICGPPPWTITGCMPTYLSSATSCANASFSSSFSMACPPYLMTSTLPAKRRMYGSASSSSSAFSTGFTRRLCLAGHGGTTRAALSRARRDRRRSARAPRGA